MRATGVVRKIDELGRIVIPVEIRRSFQIDEKDPLEIYVDEEGIYLKKYEPSCIFCGNAKEISMYKGRRICQACLDELKK